MNLYQNSYTGGGTANQKLYMKSKGGNSWGGDCERRRWDYKESIISTFESLEKVRSQDPSFLIGVQIWKNPWIFALAFQISTIVREHELAYF
jgi:hypothetical protein